MSVYIRVTKGVQVGVVCGKGESSKVAWLVSDAP